VSTITGQYFIDAQPALPSATACDERLIEAFWQASATALQPFLTP
jgi:hypothetical protein